MSKIFKYRQYHHAGYDEKSLVLPDDTTIFLTEADASIDKVQMDVVIRSAEESNYTPTYCIGGSWYLFLDSIKMTDVPFPIRNIEECESPTGCYILFLTG